MTPTGIPHVVFATSNPHKVAEVRAILRDFVIVGLDALGQPTTEPVEDGLTFADNARIKARSYAAQTGLRCLAEDSGLEVDALGGALRPRRREGWIRLRAIKDEARAFERGAVVAGLRAAGYADAATYVAMGAHLHPDCVVPRRRSAP